MKGYHNNPKATAETIDEDGWFHTGDVATCDEEGYFYIVDRIKELIKVKGLQVAPSELEEIIMGHPGVGDVGVIGVPNERAGEVPMAYIVPRQKDLSADDIHSFLEDRVARHKKLVGGIRFVQELPKNATGKLMRRQLQKMAEEEEWKRTPADGDVQTKNLHYELTDKPTWMANRDDRKKKKKKTWHET